MIETLIITVIILSLALLGLVGYIIYLTKKTKNFDINNEPEFAKLQERNIKSEEYISELKKDKEQLIENKKNVDTFKETANRSFSEYSSLVKEYKNFHEKLVGNFKYQGEYTEKKLERLLEKHTLLKGTDFTVREGKTNFDSATGEQRKVIPDYVITLPEEQAIVIDGKCSLTNFQKFANEKDTTQREIYLKKHIKSVKDHIEILSGKDYTKIHSLKAYQYVVLFMPFDVCYLSLLEHDDDILTFCHERKVILAGPISLMGLLKTVTSIKNQQKKLLTIGRVFDDAEKIYKKYEVVKGDLRTIFNSYETHRKSLQSVINNTYGSNRGLESLILKLKDDHGLEVEGIKPSTPEEKIVKSLEDPENKKVVNYK
jgi:DNA recombination protein RmuC